MESATELKNEAVCGPKTPRLNPVRKSLWHSFGTALAAPKTVLKAKASKCPKSDYHFIGAFFHGGGVFFGHRQTTPQPFLG